MVRVILVSAYLIEYFLTTNFIPNYAVCHVFQAAVFSRSQCGVLPVRHGFDYRVKLILIKVIELRCKIIGG